MKIYKGMAEEAYKKLRRNPKQVEIEARKRLVNSMPLQIEPTTDDDRKIIEHATLSLIKKTSVPNMLPLE